MKKTGTETASKKCDKAFEQVQKFYQFMNANKLEVVEFSKDETYIKLVRKHNQSVQHIPIFTAAAPAHQSAAPAAKTAAQAPAPQAVEGETIKAPMSGIFYRAPTPSSPPYVREGDAVKQGQVLCILEAMKVFNEIKAEEDFTVLKVLPENGKPVEPNQDLFLIKKR